MQALCVCIGLYLFYFHPRITGKNKDSTTHSHSTCAACRKMLCSLFRIRSGTLHLFLECAFKGGAGHIWHHFTGNHKTLWSEACESGVSGWGLFLGGNLEITSKIQIYLLIHSPSIKGSRVWKTGILQASPCSTDNTNKSYAMYTLLNRPPTLLSLSYGW